MNHKITIRFDESNKMRRVPILVHIRRCIAVALAEEKVPVPCEVNVLVTDDETIRVLNREARHIDKSTDVLSFPAFQFEPGKLPEDLTPYIDPETGLLPLGDMAISYEHAKAQAKEFGHTVKREVGYLTIHSILHLLGYDHVDEGPMKQQMRRTEDLLCALLELER